jgi:hypothetical protein
MKRRTLSCLILFFLVLNSFILQSCCKSEPDYTKSTDYDPRISISASSISTYSAVLQGNIVNKPFYTIQDCGFLWNDNPESIYNIKLIDKPAENVTITFLSNQVSFIVTLTGLSPNTTYYFMGFAQYIHPGSSVTATIYSGFKSFTTLP